MADVNGHYSGPRNKWDFMKKIDKAIATIEFIMRIRMSKVKEMERKTELSENQKIYIGQEYDLSRNIDTLITETRGLANNMLGRVMPVANDLEETVLGAAILEGHGMEIIRPILRPEHMYSERNKVVLEAMLQLPVGKVDMRTVVAQIKKNGKIDVAPAMYVAELTSFVSSSANIDYHAHVLLEFAMRREMILLYTDMIMMYDDTVDVFKFLEKLEQDVVDLKKWIR